MTILKAGLLSLILMSSLSSFAASFFNNRVSVQGYMKSGGIGLNDAAGFPMTFVIKRNATAVWCQTSATNVPVINGVFTTVLSGNANCQSLTLALDPTILAHAANSDTFTIDVVVDILKNGFGSSDDATFAGIDIVSSPLAIYANQANSATNVSGTVGVANGGTGATTAAAARANLGLGTISTVNTSGLSSDVLKGDGTFGSPAAPTLTGDVSGTTSSSTVDKLKGRPLSVVAPSNGQVLTYNNSTGFWEPQTPSTGVVSSVAGRTGAVTLTSADITDATNLNTASKIVARDSSGNFTAGTITATLSGNATNVSGTVALANGGTGATTAAAARTNLGIGTVGVINTSGLATDVLKGDGTFGAVTIPVSSVAGRTGAITLNSADVLDATNLNTASTIVERDASGNFSAGTITATLSGNATNVSGTVALVNGGTGATTAAAARTALGAAASGANTDITSITGSAKQASMIMSGITGGTTTVYTLANTPALSALTTGIAIKFRMNATNTGASTLNVDALGAKSIFSNLTGAAVAAGDLGTGKLIDAFYDGTNWRAQIPPLFFSAASLSCTSPITAGTSVVCTSIVAANVNAGDSVNCSPAADPSTTAGQVTWSALTTAGNISIRLGCNSATNCTLAATNWKCVVNK